MKMYSIVAVSALLFSVSAFAQSMPGGHDDKTVGFGKYGAPDMAPKNQEWVDKNHDGIIQKDEVTPGSQLARRFDTRDTNHDGQLTSDEYYMPPQ
ncbi:hypothetical protein [Solimonas marina]|uniref:EF-hand domain-containing protein n=1 Tax=Solimonas marina TaxID=2714601 RepID=A0A970B9K6_9GAMM|nr:hypothetical protein [Solimonas marina]NKF23439.1 hypothetical protein [Solimonas marina]